MNQFSHRKFLYTAELSATSTIFLKACGNPPEPGNKATTEQVVSADITPEQIPEREQVVLSYIPIVEAAASVIVKKKGFFAKYGMSDVVVLN